jgi:hypothetical protein
MANPASVYCGEQGGRLEIRSDAQGNEYGICIFNDGSECEEWAFFRGECQPGTSQFEPSPTPAPRYINENYGFRFNPPADWSIEEFANYIHLRKDTYLLFVGFKREGETVDPFRTGMPAGDFIDGSPYTLAGQTLTKKLLVLEGKVKVVEFAANTPVDGLLLFIWLDNTEPPNGNYLELDIPTEVITEAEQILATFTLIK